MEFYGEKNKSKELDRAQTDVGLPLLLLEPCRIKSPVELENFKRKVEKVAQDTVLCVVYLGLEKKNDSTELTGKQCFMGLIKRKPQIFRFHGDLRFCACWGEPQAPDCAFRHSCAICYKSLKKIVCA